jgi:hypothetical protein
MYRLAVRTTAPSAAMVGYVRLVQKLHLSKLISDLDYTEWTKIIQKTLGGTKYTAKILHICFSLD